MINRKTPSKAVDHLLSKNITKHSPYTRSVYEMPDSPKRFQPTVPEYTPQKPVRSIDIAQFGATKHKQRLPNNLNYKIDSIIKHNSCLLDENNKLIEMVREKQTQIQILESRLTQQLQEQQRGLIIMEKQKNRIMIEVQQQLDEKDSQIGSLISKIQILTEEIQLRNGQFKMDMMRLKQDFAKESQLKIQGLKRSQIQNSQVYETQIDKLKDIISAKQEQLQKQQHSHCLAQNRLQQQIRILNSQLKHLADKKSLEIQNLKIQNQTQRAELIQKKSQQRDIQNTNYQNAIKRMKKELVQKTLENERLNFRLQQTLTQNEAQYNYIHQQKVKTQTQMEQLQIKNREILAEEKTKYEELSQAQISNLKLFHQNFVRSLNLQIQKLIQINQVKNAEIQRLNEQILNVRQAGNTLAESDKKHIKYLQSKLQQMEISNQQQIQLLKVKMAQLHNGDVQGLSSTYQQQIQLLSQQVQKLEGIVQQNRDKLHEELLEKTQMRKMYQIQISGLQNQNTQYKLRLQAKHLQMKQSLQNIRSKHSIDSQTVIRDITVSKKDLQKRQVDIKKLHQLINAKDVQITQLNQIIRKLKEDYSQQIRQKDQEIQRLKSINQNLDNQQKKEREFFNKQLKKKNSQLVSQKEELQKELTNLKSQTYEQLINQLQQVQKEKLRLEGELTKQRLAKQSFIKSEATQKQLIQVIKLQSSAALQQQKDGSSKKMFLQEAKLKKFYQDQLKSKDKEIQQLKRRFFQKDSDYRDTENKVCDFERRLQCMMDGQTKLRDLQTKTMNLGMQNNLQKNSAQLFKLYR